MLRTTLLFLMFLGFTQLGWAKVVINLDVMPPVQPIDTEPPPGPGGGADPGPGAVQPTVNPPVAPPAYCDARGRPKDNESHYRFSIPIPDQAFSGPNLLKLPVTPGELHITVNPGNTYLYKFRFKSDLMKYPEKIKTPYTRIPGFEDKYPEQTNWICNGDTSGIQAPISGVSVMLWRGDGGGSGLVGYSPIYNQGAIPPFNANSSGVYGFTYTPVSLQVGQTMEIRIVTQTGVTANERDYQSIYESDQGLYKVFLHVEQAPLPSVFYTKYAEGVYGNIKLISIFSSTPISYSAGVLVPPPPTDDVTMVEYFVDGLLKAWVAPLKAAGEAGSSWYTSEYILPSGNYSNGPHRFYVRGRTLSGRSITSPESTFQILNNAASGLAPSIYARSGYIFIDPTVSGVSLIRAEFYREDGTYIGLGWPFSARMPDSWGIRVPQEVGDYTFYGIAYYNDGTRGVSEVLNYTVFPR